MTDGNEPSQSPGAPGGRLQEEPETPSGRWSDRETPRAGRLAEPTEEDNKRKIFVKQQKDKEVIHDMNQKNTHPSP